MDKSLKIIGVAIFLEKRTTRIPVGELRRIHQCLVFTYDELYFKAKHVIALGPEFPLTERRFESKTLFPSFQDRIPSSHNPAYEEYCHSTGIDPKEKDPFVLLSAIGRRGPSSFVFYPIFERPISTEDVIAFRKTLKLTTREFAYIFEIAHSSFNTLARKKSSGKDLLKRLEIILKFPEVALYLVTVNGGILAPHKLAHATKMLSTKLDNRS
jgi:HipA-like protein